MRGTSAHLKVNSDEFKTLLGYSGPFYNVEKLNGRLAVLAETVRVSPRELWQASGMVRNQSCQPMRIASLTARLFGQDGKLLDVATATLPLDTLRPGEPAPFVIKSPVLTAAVHRVEWQIEDVPDSDTPRAFRMVTHEAGRTLNDTYSLYGSIYNLAESAAPSVHVVAAWLDRQGKVLHVASPQIRLIADPKHRKNTVDLEEGDFEDFLYTTDDPSLVSLLTDATLVLWGTSN